MDKLLCCMFEELGDMIFCWYGLLHMKPRTPKAAVAPIEPPPTPAAASIFVCIRNVLVTLHVSFQEDCLGLLYMCLFKQTSLLLLTCPGILWVNQAIP